MTNHIEQYLKTLGKGSSAVRASRAILESRVWHAGKMIGRAVLVDAMVDAGATLKDGELIGPGGRPVLGPGDIGQLAMDYAKWRLTT